MRFTILSLGVIATLMMTSVYAGPTGSSADLGSQSDPQSKVTLEAATDSAQGTNTAAPSTKDAVSAANSDNPASNPGAVVSDAKPSGDVVTTSDNSNVDPATVVTNVVGQEIGNAVVEHKVRRAFLARRSLGHAIHKRNQAIDNTTDGNGDRKNMDEDLDDEDDDDEDDGNDGGDENRGQENAFHGNAAQGTTSQDVTDQGSTVQGDSAQGNMSSQFKQDEENDDDDDDDDEDDDDEDELNRNVSYEDFQDAITR